MYNRIISKDGRLADNENTNMGGSKREDEPFIYFFLLNTWKEERLNLLVFYISRTAQLDFGSFFHADTDTTQPTNKEMD